MKELRVTLEMVTPMFLGGATPEPPLLRAQPFRGQLRYWLRTLRGSGISSEEELRSAEGRVFGDTKVGSLVNVRVFPATGQPLEKQPRLVVPHSKIFTSQAFWNGKTHQEIILNLIARPGHLEIPDDALAALILWVNLGGIGRRSRRGFGSLRVAKATSNSENLPNGFSQAIYPLLPKDGEELVNQMRNSVGWALKSVPTGVAPIPGFPAFVKRQTQVLVCREALDSDYEKAMKRFWNEKLRSHGLADDVAYGYADNHRTPKRWASPLHVHIARSEKGFHLVLTNFETIPSAGGKTGVVKRQDLLAACKSDYHGEFVW
jgi:CRISPR-associated protein Cmr1